MGSWSQAQKYPHASVVGIDLAPVADTSTIPSNCRFEIAGWYQA